MTAKLERVPEICFVSFDDSPECESLSPQDEKIAQISNGLLKCKETITDPLLEILANIVSNMTELTSLEIHCAKDSNFTTEKLRELIIATKRVGFENLFWYGTSWTNELLTEDLPQDFESQIKCL